MVRKITFVTIGILIKWKQLQIIVGLMAMLFWFIVHSQMQPFKQPDRHILASGGWDPDLNNLEASALSGKHNARLLARPPAHFSNSLAHLSPAPRG